jgi:uncharacterized protein YdaU (DUF1376 family)
MNNQTAPTPIQRDVNVTLPLVHRDVNVTSFPYMPLDVHRLLSSETWIKARKNGKLAHALVCLWCESWRQIPAASLPNNDESLAHLAMCSDDEWNVIKEQALSGFVLCSDGRFYHPVIAEKAMNCWTKKLADQERTKNAIAERKRKYEEKQRQRDNRRNNKRNSNVTST